MAAVGIRIKLGALACSAVFCCASAVGQIRSADNMQILMNGQNAKDQKSDQALKADKNFVKNTIEGGLAEIECSQLALQKSNNDQLKRFAQRMIDDHTKLGDDLKPIASQLGVKGPTEPSKKDKAIIAKLQGLSGDDFDKAYVKLMLKDHQLDAAAFKQEVNSAQSPLVKDAATKDDPLIESHLQMIQDIAKSMNITDSGM
jgi:putative membrane protein